MNGTFSKSKLMLPVAAALAIGTFAYWFLGGTQKMQERIPGTDRGPDSSFSSNAPNPVLSGKTIPGPGQPGSAKGYWPQFRGPARDAISREDVALARQWQGGPKELWSLDVGEGYAGPIVDGGRVYLMDYDREKKQDALRCLSLEDGREIWRFAYSVAVKRNHGMSRTQPAISNGVVVSIGPKCHVAAVNAETGALLWGMDLARQFGTLVPPWYAGQCPLIDGTNVILAPAGKECLAFAADLHSGEVKWKTPNPRGWKMTHSSLMFMGQGENRSYIYCADKGVAGFSAIDGHILWDTTAWKISIATVPSPVVIDSERVFLSGGYNAGSMMLRVRKEGDSWKVTPEFRLDASVFGATQQTPILYDGHIYGVRPDGKFVCLGLDGKIQWTSDGKPFGLGPFVLGSGIIYAVNDNGLLRLLEAQPGKYTMLAQAQVLQGHESWAPLALTGGKLLVRDLTRLACIDIR